ncbi:MAG: hypothetical protein V5A72_02065 [Candidatus Nanohaloarchaea archaeon]
MVIPPTRQERETIPGLLRLTYRTLKKELITEYNILQEDDLDGEYSDEDLLVNLEFMSYQENSTRGDLILQIYQEELQESETGLRYREEINISQVDHDSVLGLLEGEDLEKRTIEKFLS